MVSKTNQISTVPRTYHRISTSDEVIKTLANIVMSVTIYYLCISHIAMKLSS